VKPKNMLDHLESFVTRDFKPQPKPTPKVAKALEPEPTQGRVRKHVAISIAEMKEIIRQEIEAHYERLSSQARVKRRAASAASIKNELPTPEYILTILSDLSEVPQKDIVGARRGGPMKAARVRQIAYWLLRHFCQITSRETIAFLGRKNHTTSIHAVKRVNQTINHPRFVHPKDDTVEEWASALIRQHPIVNVSWSHEDENAGDRS
jgi:chromosomal replication initiation ATPase DnaA